MQVATKNNNDTSDMPNSPTSCSNNTNKPSTTDLEESASSSNGGNNSDNSALVSLGNSFGFNFDSDERMSNRSRGSTSSPNNSEESDNGNNNSNRQQQQQQQQRNMNNNKMDKRAKTRSPTASATKAEQEAAESLKSLVKSSGGGAAAGSAHQKETTQDAIERLKSRAADAKKAAAASKNLHHSSNSEQENPEANSNPRKRKESDDCNNNNDDANSGGYNTDESRQSNSNNNNKTTKSSGSAGDKNQNKQKRQKGGPATKKREDRNAREKERSFRISKQIDDLRSLLSTGGIVIPKGTKSSVLTEAANYIRTLQQHQYRSEIERQQLIQQMQLIGNGVHGPQAAAAVRQAAARQGVWSLGNFGGMPPQAIVSAMLQQPTTPLAPPPPPPPADATHPTKIEDADYRAIFNSCGVGIAIASMGGGFVDCNPLFCSVSNYTKQELCAQTIFNLTERQDLQRAFEMICRMLAPSTTTTSSNSSQTQDSEPEIVVLRGSMKNRDGVGLGVSLVKGENGIPKCFCVTLVKNPSSPLDMMLKPIPIACDQILLQQQAAMVVSSGQGTMEEISTKTSSNNMAGFAPTFTAG